MSIALLVGYSARGPFSCYFFGWEDYVPELREIGLDPAVQGVPLKKKLSVVVVVQAYFFKHFQKHVKVCRKNKLKANFPRKTHSS